MAFEMVPLGDSALLVTCAEPKLDWVALGHRIRALPECLDAVPAYQSLTLHFASTLPDPEGRFGPALGVAIAALLKHPPKPTDAAQHTLPVCYHPSLAPDLDAVARHCGLTTDEVIARHCAPLYRVAFLGFAPGFPFLTGLDPSLHTPRHATPRQSVRAGSVGIAGNQTGIYPAASPGGWQLIGCCPLPLINFNQDPPTRLQPGDQLRLEPIALARFHELLEAQS
ncbi:5-oxoprolinase subunit PxpB [Halomonas denitrificans]|nr:5-oxoprolinase subunit PxpB [Halomonas denitrificans]